MAGARGDVASERVNRQDSKNRRSNTRGLSSRLMDTLRNPGRLESNADVSNYIPEDWRLGKTSWEKHRAPLGQEGKRAASGVKR